MPPEEASPVCRGQKGYREKVIFELKILFHKVIKSISSRKE